MYPDQSLLGYLDRKCILIMSSSHFDTPEATSGNPYTLCYYCHCVHDTMTILAFLTLYLIKATANLKFGLSVIQHLETDCSLVWSQFTSHLLSSSAARDSKCSTHPAAAYLSSGWHPHSYQMLYGENILLYTHIMFQGHQHNTILFQRKHWTIFMKCIKFRDQK